MSSFSASDLLQAWERALECRPVERGLALLSLFSGETLEALSALSLGNRDRRLVQLYEVVFGERIDAYAECPTCAQRFEYGMSSAEILSDCSVAASETLRLEMSGFSVELRLPDSRDLLVARRCINRQAAQRLLIERSISHAFHNGEPIEAHSVPDWLTEPIERVLTEADPNLELLINLSCSACGHEWQVLFDPEYFLCARISALARRLLAEVHMLASAYGWSETSILGLSSQRRQAYLELVGA